MSTIKVIYAQDSSDEEIREFDTIESARDYADEWSHHDQEVARASQDQRAYLYRVYANEVCVAEY